MCSDPQPDFLFLDFDGVLCDSLEECFRSSWLAGSQVAVGTELPPEPPFDSGYRECFNACRPFIRSGEDYSVVHEWAARNEVPVTQADFDASIMAHGPVVMSDRKDRIYAVRDRLLAHHRRLWLSWNPLYLGIAGALRSQVANPDVWILSTKKAEFITEILSYHGVNWPPERTIYTGQKRKIDIIVEKCPTGQAVLIDDQADHLVFGHPLCRCYLALWGYVAPGAANRAEASLTLEQAVDLIRSFPMARHPAG